MPRTAFASLFLFNRAESSARLWGMKRVLLVAVVGLVLWPGVAQGMTQRGGEKAISLYAARWSKHKHPAITVYRCVGKLRVVSCLVDWRFDPPIEVAEDQFLRSYKEPVYAHQQARPHCIHVQGLILEGEGCIRLTRK